MVQQSTIVADDVENPTADPGNVGQITNILDNSQQQIQMALRLIFQHTSGAFRSGGRPRAILRW